MFPGMPSGVTAAMEKSDENKAIFFTGSDYCVYDLGSQMCVVNDILRV